MRGSTAQNLLSIYQRRLKMAEKGTIRLRPEIVASMRQLVAGLSALSPDARVKLEIQDSKTRFRTASTGELLAEFDFKDDSA